MATRHLLFAALIATASASASVLAQKAQKPASDTLYPATITFSNRSGDAITSDGGSYANGGQVELGFHSATNDLVMRGDSGTRYITFDSTNPVPPTGPGGINNEFDVFLNIHGILDMTRNSSRAANARVSGFRFNPTKFPGTTQVDVYRNNDGTWTITADGADIAALVKVVRGKEQVVGQYYMPFQITVACPTCS